MIALLLVIAMDAGVLDAGQPMSSSAASSAGSASTSSVEDAGPNMSIDITIADEHVPGIIAELSKAIQRRDYSAAAAGVLMLAMWFLRKVLLDKLLLDRLARLMPGKNTHDLIPWITLAISMCAGWVIGIQAKLPLEQTIMSGVLIGLAASGGWSLLGKHIIKFFSREPAPASAPKEVPAPVPEVKEPEPKE